VVKQADGIATAPTQLKARRDHRGLLRRPEEPGQPASWQFELRQKRGVIRDLPPRHAVQYLGMTHGKAALIDAVEPQPWEGGGKGARRWRQAGPAVGAELMDLLSKRFGLDGQRIAQATQKAGVTSVGSHGKDFVQPELLDKQWREAVAP